MPPHEATGADEVRSASARRALMMLRSAFAQADRQAAYTSFMAARFRAAHRDAPAVDNVPFAAKI